MSAQLSSYDYEPREKISAFDRKALTPEYDTDLVFKSLEYNSNSCSRFCYAGFVFYNNLPYSVDLKDLRVETYTKDLQINQDALKEYRWDVSSGKTHPKCKEEDLECEYTYEGYVLPKDIPEDIRYVLPGETRTIRLMGEKTLNEDVEWIPTLKLSKVKYQSLPQNEVVLRQTDWSLWMKGPTVPTSGLLAFYKLDETSGTTAADSSGNNYNGATTGATVNQPGVFNKAYSFDGVDDDITICAEPTCTWSKTMCDNGCTFCSWIKPRLSTRPGDIRSIIANAGGSPNRKTTFLYNEAEKQLTFTIGNGTHWGIYLNSPNNVIELNQWNHACAVFNGSTTTAGYGILYSNGIKVATSTTTNKIAAWTTSDTDLAIASQPLVGVNRLANATIDQVTIYNRPLTNTEIQDLYEAGVTTGQFNNPLEAAIYNTEASIPVNIDVATNTQLINLTYTGIDGTPYVLWNGAPQNQTNIFIDVVNSSYYVISGTETPILGAQTIKVTAWGGNQSDYKTVWNPTQNITINTPTYPGTCTTPQGLQLPTYTKNNQMPIYLINLTQIKEYCSDKNCNNVYAITKAINTLTQAYTTFTSVKKITDADYTLCINCGLAGLGGTRYESTVYIGGYNYNHQHNNTALPGNTVMWNVTTDNLTLTSNTYFLNANYEEDNLPIQPGDLDGATLKMYCTNYAPYTINLKFYNNRKNFLITTQERPHIESRLTNNTYVNVRKKAALSSWENITTYNLQESTDTVTYYFILEDYTGTQRRFGYLDIRANVNGSLETVHREKWYFSQIYNVTLQKDVDYQIRTIIPDVSTVNYGWVNFGFITPTADSYKRLTVTQPIIDTITDHYEGLNYRYLHQANPFILGYAYNFTTKSKINWVRFTVYNSSNEIVYTTNDTTPSGQFTWSNGNENLTYRTRFEWDVDDHSYDYIENIYKGVFQTILKVRTAMDLGNETVDRINVLGMEGYKIERFMTWFITMFIGLIASAGNYGIIAVILILSSGMMSLIGWLPDEYFYILVTVTALMAVGGKMLQTKDKKGVT